MFFAFLLFAFLDCTLRMMLYIYTDIHAQSPIFQPKMCIADNILLRVGWAEGGTTEKKDIHKKQQPA